MNLRLRSGIVGLLGPNGSGKTTLLSVLGGGIRPAPGHASIVGQDLSTGVGRRAVRGCVGYLPQRFDVSGAMRLRDTVGYAAWCNGVARQRLGIVTNRALALVELTDRAQDRVRHLCGGQRQRLGLAASVAHGPRVLLLDEPTSGLDLEQRVRFRRCLRELAEYATVVLATHLLEDVQQTADHLVIMAAGKIAFDGAPEKLRALGEWVAGRFGETVFERGYRSALATASGGESG
ncbi:MAG: ABC transporter ATP-binding protein [Nocardioidaceae bacterium]